VNDSFRYIYLLEAGIDGQLLCQFEISSPSWKNARQRRYVRMSRIRKGDKLPNGIYVNLPSQAPSWKYFQPTWARATTQHGQVIQTWGNCPDPVPNELTRLPEPPPRPRVRPKRPVVPAWDQQPSSEYQGTVNGDDAVSRLQRVVTIPPPLPTWLPKDMGLRTDLKMYCFQAGIGPYLLCERRDVLIRPRKKALEMCRQDMANAREGKMFRNASSHRIYVQAQRKNLFVPQWARIIEYGVYGRARVIREWRLPPKELNLKFSYLREAYHLIPKPRRRRRTSSNVVTN